MFEKVEGIIIRTQDYGETHKIVTIFSKEYGKIAAIARGAKKPKSRMAAIAQMFIHGQFLIQLGKGLGAIQQGEVIQSYRKIRENIVQTAYASYLAELTDKLMEEKKPDYYLFKQFDATLTALSQDKDPIVLVMMYELKLYQIAGFAPVVDRCCHCGATDLLVGFSITEGGVICQRCHHLDKYSVKLNSTQLQLLRLFAQVNMDRIANISIKEENKRVLKGLIEQYYEQYGGLYIKSKKFLNQIDLFDS
ncbi:DNA repair protein RecO [Amphibacillus sediminis]|uniref:DNA repair protein RecO n=1 Tax=Amphibacillus sediminis TaxID=360185 RepID=UPI000830C656|nr:DNA repair protein RecO [Amphibacillus sediminis]